MCACVDLSSVSGEVPAVVPFVPCAPHCSFGNVVTRKTHLQSGQSAQVSTVLDADIGGTTSGRTVGVLGRFSGNGGRRHIARLLCVNTDLH